MRRPTVLLTSALALLVRAAAACGTDSDVGVEGADASVTSSGAPAHDAATSSSGTGGSSGSPSSSGSSASSGSSTSSGGASSSGSSNGSSTDAGPSDASDAGVDFTGCNVIVPDDYPTLAAALVAAPSPGLVCVRAGTHTANVTLRPHVSIRGEGAATVLEGWLSIGALADADPTPTHVSDLSVHTAGSVAFGECASDDSCPTHGTLGGGTLALSVERASVKAANYCVQIESYAGSTDVRFVDSTCHSTNGFRVVGEVTTDAVTSHELVIERSRFEGDQYAGEIAFLIDATGAQQCTSASLPEAAAGTRVHARIVNNEITQILVNAVYLAQCARLRVADRAASMVEVRHNTFVMVPSQDTAYGYGVWSNTDDPQLSPGVQAENNLFWLAKATPFRGVAPTVAVANVVAAADPFTSLATGDLRPSATSAALDVANATYMEPIDKDGIARPQGPAADVGAHERPVP